VTVPETVILFWAKSTVPNNMNDIVKSLLLIFIIVQKLS
jgi:hypothetical protein